MCRSRRELSKAYLLAKFGFDTAENEPSEVCRENFPARSPAASARPPRTSAGKGRRAKRYRDVHGMKRLTGPKLPSQGAGSGDQSGARPRARPRPRRRRRRAAPRRRAGAGAGLRASRAAAACRSRRRRPPEQRKGWKVDHASELETCRDTSLPFRIGTMLAEDSCSHIPDCRTIHKNVVFLCLFNFFVCRIPFVHVP